MPYPCFFLVPTGYTRLSLRRYYAGIYTEEKVWIPATCPQSGLNYHNAQTFFQDVVSQKDERGYFVSWDKLSPDREDSLWPTQCSCGYTFRAEDNWQVFQEQLYRRKDTDEELTISEAPPGALWYVEWDTAFYRAGPDGKVLFCKTPSGNWCVDGEASNCTMPEDKEHKCWVRHGDPTDPQGLLSGQPLHVDKNGVTCQAGAGSIQMNGYHGFLLNGTLTDHV